MTEKDPQSSAGREQGFSTLSVHAGEERQKAANSITDPIFCDGKATTAYVQDFLARTPNNLL